MKYQKVVKIGLGIIIIGSSFYYIVSNRTSLPSTQRVGSEQPEQSTLSTQTLTDGTVTYKVTPKNLAFSAPTWDFDISLDTHTGSLDQDLVSIVQLVDNKGNKYQATKWEGDQPGGHHREGILKFSPVIPRPSYIEIGIQTDKPTENTKLRWSL